jgi:hypothetical protein
MTTDSVQYLQKWKRGSAIGVLSLGLGEYHVNSGPGYHIGGSFFGLWNWYFRDMMLSINNYYRTWTWRSGEVVPSWQEIAGHVNSLPSKVWDPQDEQPSTRPMGPPVLHSLAGHWLLVLREGCPTSNLDRKTRIWKKNFFKKPVRCSKWTFCVLHILRQECPVGGPDWSRAFRWGEINVPRRLLQSICIGRSSFYQ